jgi:WD40 repeat protein
MSDSGDVPRSYDRLGDPLPPGAVARLGSVRFLHPGDVEALAYSPDGRVLASGSRWTPICLWDAGTGRLLRRLEGHDAEGGRHFRFNLAFSPDGSLLAAPREDETVWLWEAATGQLLRRLRGNDGGAACVAFAPDGSLLASGGSDGGVRLWDRATGGLVRRKQAHADSVLALALAPDGRSLASAGFEGGLRLWDVGTGRELPAPQAGDFPDTFFCLAYAPDGRTLAGGTKRYATVLWEMPAGREVARLWFSSAGEEFEEGARDKWAGAVSALAFSPDGATLACAEWDGPVYLWDVAARKARRKIDPSEGQADALAFSPDGRTLAFAGRQKVRRWDVSAGKEILDPDPQVTGVRHVAFRERGGSLSAVHTAGLVRWAVDTGEVLRALRLAGRWVAGSADGRTLALTREDGLVRLLDEESGQEVGVCGPLPRRWTWAALSPDARFLAVCDDEPEDDGEGHAIRLWETETGAEAHTLVAHDPVSAMAFSPDGGMLAAGGWGIDLWETATGERVRRYEAPPAQGPPFGGEEVYALAFSPGGEALAAGEEDGTVRLWDVAGGHERWHLRGHEDIVHSLAFSPDGRLLASGGLVDNGVCLYEVASGKVLRRYAGHEGAVAVLAFAPGGGTLASGSWDTTVLLWDVPGFAP